MRIVKFSPKSRRRSRPSSNSLRTFSILKCLGLGLAAVGASRYSAQAQTTPTTTWTGTTSQDYNDTTNWSNGFPSGAPAGINTSTGNYPIISATPTSGTPTFLSVGINSGSVGRLDQTGGSAGVASGDYLVVGQLSGTGTYNANGGSFSAGWYFIGANGGNGTLNVNGGALTATGVNNQGTIEGMRVGSGSNGIGAATLTSGSINLGTGQLSLGYSGGDTGTMTMNGGTLTSGAVNVGYSGTGTMTLNAGTVNASGQINLGNASTGTGVFNQTGGTMNGGGALTIGYQGGATTNLSSYNLSGGTATVATTSFVGSSGVNSGTLNVSGGTYNSAGAFNANSSGIVLGYNWGSGSNGVMNVSGTGVVNTGTYGTTLGYNGGNGTVNLNGGTLKTASLSRNGAGTATLNLNGGTLMPTASSTTFISGLSIANVRNGGAIIDTNGFAVTINQALNHSAMGGDNPVDGGLTVRSTMAGGMLTLTLANTFTGATSILSGGLTLTGTTTELSDTANLSLAAGTTLNLNNAGGGSETVGSLTINGHILAPNIYSAAMLNGFGYGATFGSSNGETLTVLTVPEPSTWVGGLGCLVLAAASRRRQIESWLRLKRVS